MVGYLVVGAVCILLGGYGGFTWGRSVEAKAQAVSAALKSADKAITTAVK
jgi:hypothetical protein